MKSRTINPNSKIAHIGQECMGFNARMSHPIMLVTEDRKNSTTTSEAALYITNENKKKLKNI